MSGPPDWIRSGDVFVRLWGEREIVHVMLPESPHGIKKPFLRLNSGGTDSTWSVHRSEYHRHGMRYVGTIPELWLKELAAKGTLR